MDRDELLQQFQILLINREQACRKLEEASHVLNDVEQNINDLIDQLQPRIEVTKPRETMEWKGITPSLLSSPSERVHAVLAESRLSIGEIADATGLGRRRVGPCLGALVKKGLVRNAGNGTWTAA